MPRKQENKTKERIKKALILLFILALTISGFSLNYLFKHKITAPIETALKDISSQLQGYLSEPFTKLRLIWKSYLELKNVKEENQILKLQLAELQQEITTYREALIENRRLKKLLNIKRKLNKKSIVGRIVGIDIATWHSILTINIGKTDGVNLNAPVLSQGGLVGRIIEVGLHYSKVMLITDYNSRVAVIVQRNRARGILKGIGEKGCILDYVKKGIDVQTGDLIITSGIDGIFPKGLQVGRVSSIEPQDNMELFQHIKVEPSVDLDSIEEVLVLIINSKK